MNGDDEDQSSRIFVGNLNEGFVDQVELRDHFKKYGNISKTSLLKGFGFIQFSDPAEAEAAIAGEDGANFRGNVLKVKQAFRSASGRGRGGFVPGGRGRGGMGEGGDDFGGGGYRGRGGRGGGRGRGGGHYDDRGYDDRGGFDDYRGGGGGGDRYPGPPSWNDHGHGGRGRDSPPPAEKANDCEIVCVNKMQRGFAESIEMRLKNFGMDVDVLFPNPEIPLQKIIGNIASRGVSYALVVRAGVRCAEVRAPRSRRPSPRRGGRPLRAGWR